VSKPSVATANGYEMYMGCPYGHVLEKIGDVIVGSTSVGTVEVVAL
jgi:hypothetical protein